MPKTLRSMLTDKRFAALVLPWLVGDVWLQQWSRLPSASLSIGLLLLACGLAWRGFWPLAALLFGLLWSAGYGAWRLQHQLPQELQGRDLMVQGYLASLPQRHDDHLSFDFIVTRAEAGVPEKLRLSWYRPTLRPAAGEGWQFGVRLKRPHGRLNPGGFDFEAWLFANGIAATGYVREQDGAYRIDSEFQLKRWLAIWRQAMADRIQALSPNASQIGVIKALTIGAQDDISQQQWQVFRQTGIIHLIVISGSHISLIAAWVFWLSRSLWRRWGGLRYPPHQVAALIGWLAALAYSMLVGFSLPVQRAFVMLTVAMAALLMQRQIASLQGLLLALGAVLIVDPPAVLAVGFWLSFGAVAWLFYVADGRVGRGSWWRQAMSAQWATALGLGPLLILFFQQVSLIAPLANWLAVPVIGLLLVPLSLLALLISFVSRPLAEWLYLSIDFVLQAGYWLLERIAEWPLASVSLPEPSNWAMLLAMLAMLLLLAPRGLPGRYLAWLLLLPMLVPAIDRPAVGEFKLTLLDVGQGLATVLQTASHVLVFDTGGKFSEQSDMGESVLLPYLRQQNLHALDKLIVSHGDNDHSGGAASVLQQLPVAEVLSSVGEFAERERGGYCRAGQSWQWDGVDFAMLAPDGEGQYSENDNSCVLKVSAGGSSVLMTGDIEQATESQLVSRYAGQLVSQILIAPHHGSKTSSSRGFLRQVSPELILIPAGHRNRFGFPHPLVLERYRQLGIAYYSSADSGAITLQSVLGIQQLRRERVLRRRYWMTEEAG